jgi:hypothetical protein
VPDDDDDDDDDVALLTVSSVLSKACDGGLIPLWVSFV